jgi:hypothetical protein
VECIQGVHVFHVQFCHYFEGGDMVDSDDAAAVRAMIEKFYKIGGVPVPPNLEINESVAVVFAKMLEQAMECSKAMNFVPMPPLGVPTLKWLGSQVRRALIGAVIQRLYMNCVATTIWKWGRKLQEASQGVSHRHLLVRWRE